MSLPIPLHSAGHITGVVRLAAAEQRLWPGSWAPPPPRLPAFLGRRKGASATTTGSSGGTGSVADGGGARLRLGRRQRPRNEGLTCAVLHLDQRCLAQLKVRWGTCELGKSVGNTACQTVACLVPFASYCNWHDTRSRSIMHVALLGIGPPCRGASLRTDPLPLRSVCP